MRIFSHKTAPYNLTPTPLFSFSEILFDLPNLRSQIAQLKVCCEVRIWVLGALS